MLFTAIPDDAALLRVRDIIGDRKNGIVGLLPVSKSYFLKMVYEKKWPSAVRIGPKAVAWRGIDIKNLIASFERVDAAEGCDD